MSSVVEDYYLNAGETLKSFAQILYTLKVVQKIEDGYKRCLLDDTPNVIDISVSW